MAIQVITKVPEELINDIKSLIDSGKIDTWSYDEEGDFTHCAIQWNKIAWFRPYIINDKVIFGIIGRKGINISVDEYSIYHGRFIEVLVKNYINRVASISILRPAENDFDTDKIDF